jgi:hypothetical protein
LAALAPADHVEQTEPHIAFGQAVAALATATPPLAEVPPRPKLHKLVLVFVRPLAESVIVKLRSYPARPAASQELALLSNKYAGVRSIYLFSYNCLSRISCDFGKLLELEHKIQSFRLLCKNKRPPN